MPIGRALCPTRTVHAIQLSLPHRPAPTRHLAAGHARRRPRSNCRSLGGATAHIHAQPPTTQRERARAYHHAASQGLGNRLRAQRADVLAPSAAQGGFFSASKVARHRTTSCRTSPMAERSTTQPARSPSFTLPPSAQMPKPAGAWSRVVHAVTLDLRARPLSTPPCPAGRGPPRLPC